MPSNVLHGNYGEARHTLRPGHWKHFRPLGETKRITEEGVLAPMHGPGARRGARDVERIGPGGLSARVFVGLNVGETPTYTIDDVVKATVQIRKQQGAMPDASFLAQRGVYTQSKDGKVITESSVQIIIIDFEGRSKESFAKDVNALASGLREHFHQESVIVEVQERGIVQDVFSITA